MPADVEWVMGVLRAGRKYAGAAAAKSGGPTYEFSATIIRRGDSAEIVGASGTLTPRVVRDIEYALKQHGIQRAVWDRYRARARRVERCSSSEVS